jgi:predicted metalloprotease
MTLIEIIETGGKIAGALATIGGVVYTVVAWANQKQTGKIKATFKEAINSEAYQTMLEGKVDSRIDASFASSKDIENTWRRDFEVKQAEQKTELRLINERIGQVDKRAEAAHGRLDNLIESRQP